MNDYLSAFGNQISTGSDVLGTQQYQSTTQIERQNEKKYFENQPVTKNTQSDMDKPNPTGVKVRKLRLYKQQWIKN